MINLYPNTTTPGWREKLTKKHKLELLYYAGGQNNEVNLLLNDIEELLTAAREEGYLKGKLEGSKLAKKYARAIELMADGMKYEDLPKNLK